MNYYDNFNPDVVKDLRKLNEELLQEEGKSEIDKYKILKLKQQILIKGLKMTNRGF